MSNLTQLKRELDQLHRNLDWPRPEGSEPFNAAAYNVFSKQALCLMREFQSMSNEAKRLYDLAREKAQEVHR